MRRASEAGITKLYHYESFNEKYLRDTLSRNRVHFSNPGNFNDPWDCCPMHVLTGIEDPSCLEEWSRFFRLLAAQAPIIPLDSDSVFGDPEFLERAVAQMNKTARELTIQNWRIYCLSPHSDLLMMWAHYADRHRGICLEFNAHTPGMGEAFEVSYQDRRPVVDCSRLSDFISRTEASLLTKASDWSYEKEYRFLARNGETDLETALSLKKTTGDYLELEADALTGIIVGCRADMRAVEAIVRELKPSLNIYQAVQSDFEYRVTTIK